VDKFEHDGRNVYFLSAFVDVYIDNKLFSRAKIFGLHAEFWPTMSMNFKLLLVEVVHLCSSRYSLHH